MLNIRTLPLGAYQTNTYLVWDENSASCVVIDPGYQPETILAEAKKLGIVAQKAQPIHFSCSFIYAGEYPLGFSLSCAIAKHFLGHASTHKPQPLHISVLNVTLLILVPPIQ